MHDPTVLQTIWFLLICVLWLGYFVLEGFDFGVGMLLRFIARDEAETRATIHSIGPLWDGNEVWLLVAGGATFAAFPVWYATLFSGFYIALFVILAALIVRGVAFEFWGKDTRPRWRSFWIWSIFFGSALPALLWGVAWANIVRGVPLDRAGAFDGTLFSLLNPYGLLGGLVTLSLFLAHGAGFLALRLKGDLESRALAVWRVAAPVAAGIVALFAVWTAVRNGFEPVPTVLSALAVVAAVAATRVTPGRAFAFSAATIVALFCGLFAELFPAAIVSSGPGPDLTLFNAASTSYTLTVMTVVAVVFVPIVVAYQAWSYWVFRNRLGAEDFGPFEKLRS
ncbi:cytochrome d ubiquinol oxidase subunit II [Solirubrobacter soli]|uniref:cytochrome d ubiquinol oxidase subunit II n=1 Tax=Solirubrobacter soli TaxID=363832 RepID=UPI0004015ED6|nr:cytochrome d ubiquinol oxidase subunit II [Solirubrobacter soli]